MRIHGSSSSLAMILAGILLLPGVGEAQDLTPLPEVRPSPSVEFVRINGPSPTLDGTLTDPVWETVPVADGFVQWRPDQGAPPSQDTEARLLFGDDALYVGIRAWDSEPEEVVGLLTRRNQHSPSDWVGVLIDGYHDRRTGFLFLVNAAGVKRDALIYDDTREDDGWDGVWDVAVNRDEKGWTAEFRIPYSQIRFTGNGVRSWGINFYREIARHQEASTWAPLSQEDQALVSRSGIVEEVHGLEPPRRIEIQPYTVARAAREPGDPENPFHESTATGAEVGADLKLGLSSNFTLDLTVNPDFGQVEADPGRVNLTAFETFFPERRPFFIEGSNIFRFGIGLGDGDGDNETLFHSRRIGRTPQGPASGDPDWVDRPDQTRILTAGKLSGRTEGGWSLGVLGAATQEEQARVARENDPISRHTVEPGAGYAVARVERDLNQGRTTFGSVLTSAVRDRSSAEELELRDRAFAGGVDFSHRFADDRFQARGYLLASHVAGSPEAITRTQRSPARHFQRPDAGHVTLDETRTHLTGHSGALDLVKVGGGPWRGGSLTQWRSPEFEVNDLGFMNAADHFTQALFLGYQQTRSGDLFRRWSLYTNAWASWTFGGERRDLAQNINGNFELQNGWGGWGGVRRGAPSLSPTLLRGGPALRTEEEFGGWFGFYTDSRRDLQLNWGNDWSLRRDSDSWRFHTSPNLRWRPSPSTQIQAGPFLTRNVDGRQWVQRAQADGTDHYVFGRMDQTTVGLNLRADLAVTPTLSVQLYAQPFLSAGEYDGFIRVADPRARSFDHRFQELEAERTSSDRYEAAAPGTDDPIRFDDPDFNMGRFRSNLVVRWEYRPGSSLFLVWSQARDPRMDGGSFHLGDGLDTLFSQTPRNVFMVKVNYWLNP